MPPRKKKPRIKDSACILCGTFFENVPPGSKAPTHKRPETEKRCSGSGMHTGAEV